MDKEMASYSQEFKTSIINKMMPPDSQSLTGLHKELGIPYQTLWNWKTKALANGIAAVGSASNADQWSDEAKLAIIVETFPLNTAETSEYCRKKGIYPEQLHQWRNAAVAGQSKSLSQKEREELRALKIRCKQLEKDLSRKEKALAEAAALMMLRKKANAIWGESEGE